MQSDTQTPKIICIAQKLTFRLIYDDCHELPILESSASIPDNIPPGLTKLPGGGDAHTYVDLASIYKISIDPPDPDARSEYRKKTGIRRMYLTTGVCLALTEQDFEFLSKHLPHSPSNEGKKD